MVRKGPVDTLGGSVYKRVVLVEAPHHRRLLQSLAHVDSVKVGKHGIPVSRIRDNLEVRPRGEVSVPLERCLAVEQLHVLPQEAVVLGVARVLLKEPLGGDDHIVDPSLAPSAVDARWAVDKALAVVLQHCVRQGHKAAQRRDDLVLVAGRVGLCQTDQAEEEGHARPKVPVTQRLWADPAIVRLQAEHGIRDGVNLADQPFII
jgi:hypothetical protein